jgi:hypothetical protein
MSGTYDARHRHDYPATTVGKEVPGQLPAADVPGAQRGSAEHKGNERQQEAQRVADGGSMATETNDAGAKVRAAQLNGSDESAAQEQKRMDQSGSGEPDLFREAKDGPLAKDELKAGGWQQTGQQ